MLNAADPARLSTVTARVTARLVRTHSTRPEALTLVQGAGLVKWSLAGDRLHPAASTASETPITALSAPPDSELFAVATLAGTIELRRWDDLSLAAPPLPAPAAEGNGSAQHDITAIALSPDEQWLAIAREDDDIYLCDSRQGSSIAIAEGSDWTSTLAFSPQAQQLAIACSFPGGSYARVDALQAGELEPVYDFVRSNSQTPPADFVDALAHLAFSPDARWLALFETATLHHDKRGPGWRGNLALYSLETGTLQWCAPLDAGATGDRRSLNESGYEGGFYTELSFLNDSTLACGATDGKLLLYDLASGQVQRRLDLGRSASVRSLASDSTGTLWIVLADGELLAIPGD